MLTDLELRAPKPAGRIHKVADQRGLYVAVTLSGVVMVPRTVSSTTSSCFGRRRLGSGVILPQGIARLADIPALTEDTTNELPGLLRQLLMGMLNHVREIDHKIDVMEAQIRQWHRHSDASQRLAKSSGSAC